MIYNAKMFLATNFVPNKNMEFLFLSMIFPIFQINLEGKLEKAFFIYKMRLLTVPLTS